MLLRTAFFVGLLAISFAGVTGAAPAQAVAESDSQKFVRITRFLEAHPLQDESKELHGWLIDWATKSPDVVVDVCDILGPIPKETVPYGSNLLTQYMFGNAAFQIEYPDKKDSALDVQLAGIESLLRSYVSLLAIDAKARIPYFDDLLERQKNGSLREFMTPIIAAKCTADAAV